jgi:hypothetical protein
MVFEVVCAIAVVGMAGYTFLMEKDEPDWDTLRSRLKTSILDEELVEMKDLSGSMLDRMTDDLVLGNKVRRWN